MKRVLALFFLLAAGLAHGAAPSPAAPETLDLPQLLDLAYAQNPDMQAAAERIGQSQAQVAEALAAFYPKLTGRLGYSYSNDPAMAFSAIVSQRRFNNGHFENINNPGFVENFRPELVGTLSLFRGGQDYYRKKAAELGVEAAELQRAALRNDLAAAVTAAYYAALAAPQHVEVARRSLAAVENELGHARHEYQAGARLKADVLSLEVRRSEAREAELHAENAVELTRSALKRLVGLGAADRLAVRENATPAPSEIKDELAELIAEGLARRPEMQAASRVVEMREKEVRAEKGGHLPRINAYAAYGLNERSPEFDFRHDNLTLGVNAEVDLFSGGAVSARISGSERKLAEARAAQEKARLAIEDEIQQARANFQEAEARREVAENAAQAAAEALRLVNEEYRAGAATVTRFLEAEADRARSETRAVTARYDIQVAKANLQKAVGYWK
ncbi:TolC family protein [Methylococcus sp. EFPC2]|uniref:TolC family protein n=1 Tax=Methylococcus sp. EFPC2 TaxID=2812648 RepID=UPI0019683C04|nr:TolC family protein [Methylococcus sp. EFPC2]QSA96655.1 TolC family protein [Methylococcus sp. EFPC2]